MATVPTLDDVAALVGVSTRTVSRVLRDEGGYSAATEQRVRDAVDELGYFPNLLARGLSGRRSGTIGLVGPNMSDPFFPELADEIQRRALDRGRTTFYASSFRDPDQQRTILGSLRSYGVDAVVLHPVPGTRSEVEHFATSGTPVVVIDREWHGPNLASVSADIEHGARLAVEAFVRQGRRHIGMVVGHSGGHEPARSAGRRQRGFEAALPDDADELVEAGSLDIGGGRVATERLLAREPQLDAVFAYNDLMAFGALDALEAAHHSVPADVSVIGYDDIAAATISRPTLSTIRHDRAAVATQAIELLEQLVERPDADHGHVRVPVELIERGSTARIGS